MNILADIRSRGENDGHWVTGPGTTRKPRPAKRFLSSSLLWPLLLSKGESEEGEGVERKNKGREGKKSSLEVNDGWIDGQKTGQEE